MLALDGAATEYFKKGKYHLAGEGKTLDAGAMVDYLAELFGRYPILSIEDGMSEDDWDGWAALTERLGDKVPRVGDDIFVNNQQRIAESTGKGDTQSIKVKERKSDV